MSVQGDSYSDACGDSYQAGHAAGVAAEKSRHWELVRTARWVLLEMDNQSLWTGDSADALKAALEQLEAGEHESREREGEDG